MYTRIKQIRKTNKLTQAEFGERIGATRDTICNIELGRMSISQIIILSICREFNVNEVWLRTGEGEMFITPTRDEEIARFIDNVQMAAGDSFKKRFISALAKLDEDQWEVLADLIDKLTQQ